MLLLRIFRNLIVFAIGNFLRIEMLLSCTQITYLVNRYKSFQKIERN